ncbi:hypothetical protein QJQ45_002156 [Haematococcus lacustris]|nr:hypothetical protein QJQ45_002156 [Haematococcus lacustris]
MDLVVKLPVGVHGYDSICVVVDRLSKMVHLIPCIEAMDAKEFAELYIDHVFKYHGLSKVTISDRGATFNNQFWIEVRKLIGVDPAFSTAYHPQTDGQTERTNQIVEEMLRHYILPTQEDWPRHLAFAEFAINNSWQESIQSTPFLVNYGQSPITPVLHKLPRPCLSPSAESFAKKWEHEVKHAQECMRVAQDRQQRYANKRRRDVTFSLGDSVLLSTKNLRNAPGRARKFLPRYVGPFKVTGKLGEAAYRLELPPTMSRLHPVFHVSLLKKYTGSQGFHPPPVMEWLEDAPHYEVHSLLSHRQVRFKKRMEYLVKWTGYDDTYNTWEPEAMLAGAPQILSRQLLIEELEERKKLSERLKQLRRSRRDLDTQIGDVEAFIRASKAGVQLRHAAPRTVVRTCPAADCRGCINADWTVTQTASVQLLAKDSRTCPKCPASINNIEGCDQMFCTVCHTAFSFQTGQIERGVIHNPLYYEWQRQQNGGVAPRAPGDDPCRNKQRASDIGSGSASSASGARPYPRTNEQGNKKKQAQGAVLDTSTQMFRVPHLTLCLGAARDLTLSNAQSYTLYREEGLRVASLCNLGIVNPQSKSYVRLIENGLFLSSLCNAALVAHGDVTVSNAQGFVLFKNDALYRLAGSNGDLGNNARFYGGGGIGGGGVSFGDNASISGASVALSNNVARMLLDELGLYLSSRCNLVVAGSYDVDVQTGINLNLTLTSASMPSPAIMHVNSVAASTEVCSLPHPAQPVAQLQAC